MNDLERAMMLFGGYPDDDDESPWIEVEEKCEGKTILTLSANGYSGIIIRFTDGSKFSMINGSVSFDDSQRKEN